MQYGLNIFCKELVIRVSVEQCRTTLHQQDTFSVYSCSCVCADIHRNIRCARKHAVYLLSQQICWLVRAQVFIVLV